MAESLLWPIAKSTLGKLISFTNGLMYDNVTEEINAAKSAKKDLKAMADNLTAICAVLEDAEVKQYSNQAMNVWLKDLKSVVYDINDLLDDVATDALQQSVIKGHFIHQAKYFLSKSNPIVSRFKLSHKIKDLNENLEHVVAKKAKFGLTERPVESPIVIQRDLFNDCSFVNKSSIIGRDEAEKDIMGRLFALGDTICPLVFPVVGMGGIGKTTLAKLVFDDLPNGKFEKTLWACVSDKFNLLKLLEDLIKAGGGEDTSNHNLSQLVQKLQNLLKDKKYFMVLDDVWLDDIATWTEFKSILEVGKAGSIILITTRSAKVAAITQTSQAYDLDRLTDDVCWSIFKQLAFMDHEEEKYPVLCELGKSIVKKCAGIPLVVKSIGSLLSGNRDERQWQKIINIDSMINFPGDQYNKVFQLLKLSYNNLPSHLKPCFAYCSLKAKDIELYPTQLIYMWNAHGLLPVQDGRDEMEDSGYASAVELLSRSLLEHPNLIFNGTVFACKIHDLLHDLAVQILGDELAIVTRDELKVTERTRHIIWGYEGPDGLKGVDFPKELLIAKKARTIRFGYRMNHVSLSFLEGVISNFSFLRVLEIGDSQFEELPRSIGNLKHLRGLKLSYNPLLKSLPDTVCKLLNLETLDLYNCEKLEKLPAKVYKLLKVRYFVVTTCQNSFTGTNIIRLCSLRFLWIYSCKELVSLWDDDNVGRLASLRRLYIQNCPQLTCLPNSMEGLTALEDLMITNCQGLDLGIGDCLSGLRSLRSLAVIGLPRLVSLPDSLQSAANTLQFLTVGNCGSLTKLGDWLRHCSLLRKVSLQRCPNLSALPTGFGRLSSLQELNISSCPHLTRRCAVPDGEDYRLVRHVIEFSLDGHRFTPQQRNVAP